MNSDEVRSIIVEWAAVPTNEVYAEIEPLVEAMAAVIAEAKADAWDEALTEAAGLYMDPSSADHMKTTNPYRSQA